MRVVEQAHERNRQDGLVTRVNPLGRKKPKKVSIRGEV
jgi:hypothetical protein